MAAVQVQLSTSGNRSSVGSLDIHTPSGPQKLMQAGLNLVGFWIAAACTIPIMVLHFVTVPALLLAGVVRFITIIRAELKLLGGSVTCPACESTLPTGKGFRRWPLEVVCIDCGRPVDITPSADAPAPSLPATEPNEPQQSPPPEQHP